MRPGPAWRLDDWLDWQQQLHPRAIDLGLDRVRKVWQKLDLDVRPARIVTVAGTNGKGSCVEALQALALAGGRQVGCYSSPHLWRYNERIRINGHSVGDAEIISAFEQVEAARADVSLSYFEYGTLAALCLFARQTLDLWVLEVGLGGRLDAVNLLDADVAVVTSVGLDHAEYLGSDLAGIAREKLAIGRPGRPLLLGRDLPREAVEDARRAGRQVKMLDETALPAALGSIRWPPGLVTDNLQLAVLALQSLQALPDWPATRRALEQLTLPGRCELRRLEDSELILDVAHNREAAHHLAEYLRTLPPRRPTTMVFAALGDKPVEDMTAELDPLADQWLLVPLDSERALSPAQLAGRLRVSGPVRCCASMAEALDQVRGSRGRGVVWGSFLTVAQAGEMCNG